MTFCPSQDSRLDAPVDSGQGLFRGDTHLAYVVCGAVVAVGLDAALAVALHARLGVHIGRGRLGGSAARAAGVLRPVTHLSHTDHRRTDQG